MSFVFKLFIIMYILIKNASQNLYVSFHDIVSMYMYLLLCVLHILVLDRLS